MPDFYLGGPVDDGGDRLPDQTTDFDPSDLTTHGVIVGMTGSGKTGLGIIYLEEALRAGIPTLVIDPKGDMTNLLLTFPDLAPADFRPWIDEASAANEGRTPDEEATRVADLWSNGLASWNLGGSDIGDLRANSEMAIYTPGSQAGLGLNVVGSLEPPPLSWETEAETMRDEIEGFVSGLLDLIGVDADPISSREHILLANLVERAWRASETIDVPTLIGQVAEPPLRKLGVFDVDTFFPRKDRMALAMQLNGLLASPSFAAWMEGDDVDPSSLLWRDGKPRASILYLAHLSEAERQFVVTTVLAKVITWMRTQPGSSELRALIYMDEVFGFVPPTAQPPAKKPILTILKQARAFGVGMLLSTQNPVDLDYKAMSNAGTWCIGRLQTERDKLRIIEALTTASGDVDTDNLDARISNLPKRTFLLHSTRAKHPSVFTTRWAMSYLRGPMTRDEIAAVQQRPVTKRDAGDDAPPTERAPSSPRSPESADLAVMPPVADGVDVCGVHPSAPWGSTVGFDPNGDHLEAALAVTASIRFDETRAGIDHTEAWEAMLFPLNAEPGAIDIVEIDHDPRDFGDVPHGVPFITPDAPISSRRFMDKVVAHIKRRLEADERLELFRNRSLKLVSRPGETLGQFDGRCEQAARDRADEAMAKVTQRYTSRIRKAKRDYESAVRSADAAAQRVDDARGDAFMGLALDLLTGRKPRANRSAGRSAENKLRTAEDRVAAKREKLDDLAADLESDASAAAAEWLGKATDIEPFTVGLERDDIDVSDVKLVWIRRGSPSEG